jgi:hypothetical protein
MKHRSERKAGFQHSTLIAAVMLLLILFISVGYMFFLHQPGLSPDQLAALSELQERRDEWELERPPAFRYEVERQCACPLDYTEPFTVVEYLDETDNVAWIDGFFADIEEAMLGGETVPVRYDARFGFPDDFKIGDEDTFVRDFEVLEYADEAR